MRLVLFSLVLLSISNMSVGFVILRSPQSLRIHRFAEKGNDHIVQFQMQSPLRRILRKHERHADNESLMSDETLFENLATMDTSYKGSYQLCVDIFDKILHVSYFEAVCDYVEKFRSVSVEVYVFLRCSLFSSLIGQRQYQFAAILLANMLKDDLRYPLRSSEIVGLLRILVDARSSYDDEMLVVSRQVVDLYNSLLLANIRFTFVSDHVHEIAIRALINLEEWDSAVAILQKIGRRHLSTDEMIKLSLQLINLSRAAVGANFSFEMWVLLATRIVICQPLVNMQSSSALVAESFRILSQSHEHCRQVGELCELFLSRGILSTLESRTIVEVARNLLDRQCPLADVVSLWRVAWSVELADVTLQQTVSSVLEAASIIKKSLRSEKCVDYRKVGADGSTNADASRLESAISFAVQLQRIPPLVIRVVQQKRARARYASYPARRLHKHVSVPALNLALGVLFEAMEDAHLRQEAVELFEVISELDPKTMWIPDRQLLSQVK